MLWGKMGEFWLLSRELWKQMRAKIESNWVKYTIGPRVYPFSHIGPQSKIFSHWSSIYIVCTEWSLHPWAYEKFC